MTACSGVSPKGGRECDPALFPGEEVMYLTISKCLFNEFWFLGSLDVLAMSLSESSCSRLLNSLIRDRWDRAREARYWAEPRAFVKEDNFLY